MNRNKALYFPLRRFNRVYTLTQRHIGWDPGIVSLSPQMAGALGWAKRGFGLFHY
jgi:hypothetical protein